MQVKVWNRNTHPFTQLFKGDRIHIPAGQYHEMEELEAVEFLGTYYPPVKDGNGNDLPEGFKKLEIDRGGAPIVATGVKPLTFTCMSCKEVFEKESSLTLHSEHAHKGAAIVDEEAEAEIVRKRGRPAKHAAAG